MVGYTVQQALNVIANAALGTTPIADVSEIEPTQGSQDVASAGTAEALLAASGEAKIVLVQARPGNTGNIYVGDSSVSSSVYGFLLEPGDSVPLSATSLSKIDLTKHFIDSDVNGEGVTFLMWV